MSSVYTKDTEFSLYLSTRGIKPDLARMIGEALSSTKASDVQRLDMQTMSMFTSGLIRDPTIEPPDLAKLENIWQRYTIVAARKTDKSMKEAEAKLRARHWKVIDWLRSLEHVETPPESEHTETRKRKYLYTELLQVTDKRVSDSSLAYDSDSDGTFVYDALVTPGLRM